jgi:hypothetical protein
MMFGVRERVDEETGEVIEDDENDPGEPDTEQL